MRKRGLEFLGPAESPIRRLRRVGEAYIRRFPGVFCYAGDVKRIFWVDTPGAGPASAAVSVSEKVGKPCTLLVKVGKQLRHILGVGLG
jgi:hypothetical protein